MGTAEKCAGMAIDCLGKVKRQYAGAAAMLGLAPSGHGDAMKCEAEARMAKHGRGEAMRSRGFVRHSLAAALHSVAVA